MTNLSDQPPSIQDASLSSGTQSNGHLAARSNGNVVAIKTNEPEELAKSIAIPDADAKRAASKDEPKTPDPLRKIANEASDGISLTGSTGEHNPNLLSEGDFHSCTSINELHGDAPREAMIDHLPTPPDGGYGWVIVAAAFVSNLIVDGIANSFGSFMAPYQRAFNSTKAATSLIGSILIGAYLLSGPLAGGLLNRYDARRVVAAGAILSCIAFLASTLSPNLIVHCILYGLFGGIGFGLIYLPAIVVVSQYFESKRALATGIAVSGSGLGTFVMPLLCKLMLETVGWRLALCVLAAMVLTVCVGCGLLYRPLQMSEIDPKVIEEVKQQALLAALSRAEGGTEDSSPEKEGGEEDGSINVTDAFGDEGEGEEVEGAASGGTSPLNKRVTTTRSDSQCTNHSGGDGKDDVQPLLNSVEHARSTSGGGDEEGGGQLSGDAPASHHASMKLSPIHEGKAASRSRPSSQHYRHRPTANNTTTTPRPRKPTITSLTSDYNVSIGELSGQALHFQLSRSNLASNHNLSRVSAKSYGQSLSRIGQAQSIRAGESVLSIAMTGVDPKEFARPMARRDVFLQGSISNTKEFEDEGSNYKAYRESQLSIPMAVVAQGMRQSMQNIARTDGELAELSSRLGASRYSRLAGDGLIVGDEEDTGLLYEESKYFKWIPFAVRNTFGEMINLALLKEPIMLLLCGSSILSMLGFYVPFVFIIDLAISRGSTDAQATMLLSVIGITNTVGRVFFGWVADRRWLTALTINNWALLICGLLTILCPLLPGYWWLLLYASLFGFIVSAYICLTSIVLSDLLGMESLTNSFGLVVVSRGFASLLGTPLAGIVYDTTNSYSAPFIFAGALIVLAGMVSSVIGSVHRYERSQMKNEGDYNPASTKNLDSQSVARLSVLSEKSEEAYGSEYQKTIQSLMQQRQLIKELEEYKRTAKEGDVQLHDSPQPNDVKAELATST